MPFLTPSNDIIFNVLVEEAHDKKIQKYLFTHQHVHNGQVSDFGLNILA